MDDILTAHGHRVCETRGLGIDYRGFVCHWAVLLVCVVLFSGCGVLRIGGEAKDLLAVYEASDEYVVLPGEGLRGVLRPARDAALWFSVRDQGGAFTILEHGSDRPRLDADRYADRLLMGTSGTVDAFSEPWTRVGGATNVYEFTRHVRLDGGAFRLRVDRKIRFLGRSALSGFVTGSLPSELDVAGYESRTVYTNPGPLPWPEERGLPYIRIEGDVLRERDALVLLHIQGNMLDSVVRQSKLVCATNAPALLGAFKGDSESRLVLPMDFVLPRVALLDRANEILTLFAYTPPVGIPGARSASVLRPDPEIVVAKGSGAYKQRWFRMVTAGTALPLATGGSTRHNRQTFHVRGPLDALIPVAAQFCRLQEGVVRELLQAIEEPPQ